MTFKVKATVRNTMKGSLMFGLTCGLLSTAFAAPVENFGQNIDNLRQAFQQKHVHFLQVGDSHTAGDFFTEQLRKRLQNDVGDGGIGFAYPMAVPGQRAARNSYQSTGWQLSNSRTNRDVDYPLGGMVASPVSSNASLTLTSQSYTGDWENARIIVKGNVGQTLTIRDSQSVRQLPLNRNGWQTVDTQVVIPFTINANSNTSIGGFWLNRGIGGTVSAMGINGATQDFWLRWHKPLAQDLAQSQADLIILAYGTNEAFQGSPNSQVNAIQYAIDQIRQGLPNASILLVNASESLKSTSGSCGVRSPSLDASQANIRELARQNKTLYWSWQEAMGGTCSMKKWIAQGLGRSDGVHFTKDGYEKAANNLYDNLKNLLQVSVGIPNNNYSFPVSTPPISVPNNNNYPIRYNYEKSGTIDITNQSSKTYSNYSQPKAKICDANGKCTSI